MEFSNDCLEYNSAVWDARGVSTPHPQSAQKKDSNKTKQEESGIFYCANVYDIPYLHQLFFF